MARHKHIVLGLDDCEIIGLALPEKAETPTPSDEPRISEPLLGIIDGVNTVFHSESIIDRSDLKKAEYVYYNGVLLESGASNDYSVSESIPGSGYDTITFVFSPKPGDKLEIKYIPIV